MTLHEFLEHHGLAEWTETFDRELVDLATLPELSEDDLKELGLPMGARKRLQRAIRGGSSGSSGVVQGDASLGDSSSIDLSGVSLLDDPTMLANTGMPPQGIPEVIDGYRVESILGQGGMGAVYRVKDKHTGQPLALKTIKVDMLRAEQVRQRFQREYGLLQGLSHPSIVRVYAMGEDPQWGLYYTMELLTGGTLADWTNKRKRSPKQCLKVWKQIAESLQVAHNAGIIHRDIKPENIMLRDARTSVIVDWGLGCDGAARTHTGARGTAAWAPPEQATGRTGPFTDVYGMSALLLWLLTDELPTNDHEAIRRFLHDCKGPVYLTDPIAQGLAGERRRFDTLKELHAAVDNGNLSVNPPKKASYGNRVNDRKPPAQKKESPVKHNQTKDSPVPLNQREDLKSKADIPQINKTSIDTSSSIGADESSPIQDSETKGNANSDSSDAAAGGCVSAVISFVIFIVFGANTCTNKVSGGFLNLETVEVTDWGTVIFWSIALSIGIGWWVYKN